MNAVEREHKISKLKSEINDICTSLAIGNVLFLLGWLCLEPMLKEVANLGGVENKPLAYIQKMFFDYAMVGMFWIGYIIGLIAIFKKKRAIKRYKKEKDVSLKINIQKEDINQNPIYVIDHSKDKPNQYEKGDRGMMKRVFNQNNNVSINSGKGNTSKTKSKGSPTRSYNGTTRSSNNTESNNIALDVALGSSMYSRGNDNDCSSPNGSGYDGGSSCD
ncbi:hypothetical protein U9R71_31070 [Bacillus toyonensis]|uniref:hypothetical protein n=1 Tax=Bacillus toyonensis TaxID=155322 RepID=UPI0018D0130F|nr:hypothetical protein [Bacillus toyonensis]MBH0357726.1 hypothetical protein [Bacillus toyonensis biovar Thuringiensis]